MLAEWQDAIAEMGASEYFNTVFDWFPDHPPLPPNSTLTKQERDALTSVLVLIDEATRKIAQSITAEQLIASGWPQRIEPLARAAYDLMRSRGQFSEDEEEDRPSGSAET